METIINLLPLSEDQRAAFSAAAPNEKQIFRPSPALQGAVDVPKELLSEATIILGCADPAALKQCGNLKWLQAWFAGTDNYTAPGVFPAGAVLTSATGAYGQSVSEHMLASLLSLMKRLPAYRDNQHAHVWRDQGKAKSPAGSTVLVLGTGDIGGSFARMLKGLGSHTVGLSRHPDRPVEGFDELHAISSLDDWLPRADVVASILPASPETYHILNAERLARIKRDAILVNAGRGNAVDCLALADVLSANRLWGAALDVTEPEPLPRDHPLWDCPNLLLTPHTAGSDHLDSTVQRIIEIVLENLKRFLAGEPLRNRVI